MKNRENCFDLIRHFAACLVLYSHHYALSGFSEPTFPHWDSYGFVAVAIFFAISGYFMPASFSSSGDFLTYMEKRCRRIFPGLIVCSFWMSYVIGGIFTPEPVIKYLTDISTFKTGLLFSAFIGRPIPGVFSDFIFKHAINGSLWTLPIEFVSYIILGIALCYSNSWKPVLMLLAAAVVTTMLTFSHKIANFSFYAVPVNYLAIFGIAFTTGSLMSMTQEHWFRRRWHLAVIAVVFLVIFQGRPEMPVFGTMSLAVLTIVAGISFRDKLINGKFDLSYGIYIYAFPTQQIVINCVTQRFWLSMLLAFVFTLIAAYLSYRFVEKPFLYANARKKNRTIVFEEPQSSIG